MHDDYTSLPKQNSRTESFLASIDQFFHAAFEQFTNRPPETAFPVHTREERGSYKIEAKLGNVDKKQIELDVAPQTLTIRVYDENELTTLDEQTQEISYQRQSHIRERTIHIPFLFREEDVRAHFEAPMLTIFISGRRKTIPIT